MHLLWRSRSRNTWRSLAGHGANGAGPVFRAVTSNCTCELDRSFDRGSVYHNIFVKYASEICVSAEVNGLCAHSLHATAATNALAREVNPSNSLST